MKILFDFFSIFFWFDSITYIDVIIYKILQLFLYFFNDYFYILSHNSYYSILLKKTFILYYKSIKSISNMIIRINDEIQKKEKKG